MDMAGNGEDIVVLSSAQTIRTCQEFADQLRERLSSAKRVVVDAAELAEGDVTLIQVLLAARKSATSIGCDFEIVNPSAAFLALVRQCGLAAV